MIQTHIDIEIINEYGEYDTITIPFCDPKCVEQNLMEELTKTKSKFTFKLEKRGDLYKIIPDNLESFCDLFRLEIKTFHDKKNDYLREYTKYSDALTKEYFVSTLLGRGANPLSTRFNALKTAVEQNDIEIVKIIVEYGKIHLITEKSGVFCDTPIFKSVNHPNILKYFLKYVDKDWKAPGRDRTLIYEACYEGNIESVRLLLSLKANQHANRWDQTPLWIAAAMKHTDIVDEIVKVGYSGMWTEIQEWMNERNDCRMRYFPILEKNEPSTDNNVDIIYTELLKRSPIPKKMKLPNSISGILEDNLRRIIMGKFRFIPDNLIMQEVTSNNMINK